MTRIKLSLSFVCLTALVLVGCAKAETTSVLSTAPADESEQFAAALAAHMSGPLSDPRAHEELRQVTTELQTALLTAMVPEYKPAIRGRAILGCDPKVKIVLVGVAVEFTASETCKLNGTVTLRLPLFTAIIDLDVVGLSFIDRISLDAEAVLNRGSSGVTLNLVFLNGHINLKASPLFPSGSLTANGRVNLKIDGAGVSVDSRINAFESSTGTGVALLAKIGGGTEIKGCLLTGGVGSDPDAGSANACFRIGG